MIRRLICMSRTMGYRFSTSFKYRRLNDQETRVFSQDAPRDIRFLRNIGIIAHIDAGKTTTTERMLYYAGCLAHPGEVHTGDTKMDYLEQERKRGITIRAATISFAWSGHHINLIDTPGHIDFTAEVERSLRVLDGAVVIFDGTQGVEPQSETVWGQANKFKLPRICFANKLDRPGASLKTTADSIQKILNVKPLILTIPIGEDDKFHSVIHLPSMKIFEWTDNMGLYVDVKEIERRHPLYTTALEEREKLVSGLGEYHEPLAERYLAGQNVTEQEVDEAIKIALKTMQCTVLLAGSALKNRGIQLLLESIVKYLPSPIERGPLEMKYQGNTVIRNPSPKDKLCAYAFKIINDEMHGSISFIRTYSGSLKLKSNLYNVATKKVEKVNQLSRVLADEMTHIHSVNAGDIGAIVGNNDIKSGDTLIAEGDNQLIELEGIDKHAAMFVCAVTAREAKDEQKLLLVLEKMCREDPSIFVTKNEETGQTCVNAIGELQLEILKDRVSSEYGVKMRYGKLRVSYRESILGKARKKLIFDRFHVGESIYAQLDFEVEPVDNKSIESENQFVFDFEEKGITENVEINQDDPRYKRKQARTETFHSLDNLPEEFKYGIQEAVSNSLLAGKLLGFKMLGVKITVKNGRWSEIRTNLAAVKLCASELARTVMQEANPCLMEPFMNVSIVTPEGCMSDILADISVARRGEVGDIQDLLRNKEAVSSKKRITATMPLVELSGYANYLRTLTKGQGSYSMEFDAYKPVKPDRAKKIIEDPFS